VVPELALCRAEIGREHRGTETILRTVQNLGDARIPNKVGTESGMRIAPDGATVVFARERTSGRPESTELFVAPVDNSAGERRLTANSHLDDAPCWSPQGDRVLYSSEASGSRRLWITALENPQPTEFLAGTSSDTEPDWHAGTDRIAFSRLDPTTGRWRITLANGDGTGVAALTDGGTSGTGDRQPSFHPSGDAVVFVRIGADGRGDLWVADVATGTAAPLLAGPADVALPRWAPQADRIFLTVADPDAGRPGHRLGQVLADGTGLVLLAPDRRFAYPGLDPFPDLPAVPQAEPAPRDVAFPDRDVNIDGLFGPTDPDFLRREDATPVIVATTTFQEREVAGVNINTRIPPDVDPVDVLEVRVRIVAAARRFGGDSVLRATLRNHVERRFDTVVERTPTDQGYMELSFATASLAHVDREGYISTAVIADLEPGARAELWVDLIEIQIVVRAAP